MEGIIRVTPEVLMNTASEFSSQGTQISALTSEMMTLVTGLSSIWEGEASAAYIAKFEGLQEDMDRMFSMVSEHVSDLESMAAVYQASDEAAEQEASGLVSGVIE